MRAKTFLLLSILWVGWACGRVGYESATQRDGDVSVGDDGSVSPDDAGGVVVDASGVAVDADPGPDAELPPIGICAQWSNWMCVDGNGECYASCGAYTADCFPTGCQCETNSGIFQCATQPGNKCDSCRQVMLDGCCGPPM